MIEEELQLDNFEYHLKSHSLIYSSTDLSSKQMDIFALMLTQMREDDWYNNGESSTPVYSFTSSELSIFFNTPKKQLYSLLKKPCEVLSEKTIGIDDGKSFNYRPILSEVEYKNGTLTISPNEKLRDVYIINACNNGHAKIDNKIFRALGNPNSKKVFEFLSRYRFDKTMYHMRISKLQTIFGVYGSSGRVLKKSYVNKKKFIKCVIEPALKDIGKSREALDKVSLASKHGRLGYELIKEDTEEPLIRFLVTWTDNLTEEDVKEASKYVIVIMQEIEDMRQRGEKPTIHQLTELRKYFKTLGRSQDADLITSKIKIRKQEILDEKMQEKDKELTVEKQKIDDMLSNGFLDF